jgi:hypothetical protein
MAPIQVAMALQPGLHFHLFAGFELGTQTSIRPI